MTAAHVGQGTGKVLRGSCLCGKVTYEIRGAPKAMYYCHCGMCRKATGSTFATNMLVREADFALVSGQQLLKAYPSSPGEHRHFCSQCGSPVYSKAEARKGLVSVRCGGLDGDPPIRPTAHIYTGSKAPWFEIRDHVPQFTEGAER